MGSTAIKADEVDSTIRFPMKNINSYIIPDAPIKPISTGLHQALYFSFIDWFNKHTMKSQSPGSHVKYGYDIHIIPMYGHHQNIHHDMYPSADLFKNFVSAIVAIAITRFQVNDNEYQI